MGQAKARGSREQRIALAEQKAAEAREADRMARAAQLAQEEAERTERMHRVNSQRLEEGKEPLHAGYFLGSGRARGIRMAALIGAVLAAGATLPTPKR